MTLFIVVVAILLTSYLTDKIWKWNTIAGPDDLWKYPVELVLFVSLYICGLIVVVIWGEWWEPVVALLWFGPIIKELAQDLILYWKDQ